MKTLRQFLRETPWVNDDIGGEKEEPGSLGNQSYNNKGYRKPSDLRGHTIKKYVHSMKTDDEQPMAYAVYNPAGKVTLRVHGAMKDGTKKFNVSALQSTTDNLVPAHELYHHLVTHHGIHLHSDYEQSEGGMKVWKKLQKMPGIHMQSYNGSSQKYSELRSSFQRTYDMDSSTRLAAKKKP